MAFVGTKTVQNAEELRSLLDQFSDQSTRYFLRWAHRVSGFVQVLPEEFPSPEGQLFGAIRELRWRQHADSFHVLILSTQDSEPGFTPLAEKLEWDTKDQNASIHPSTETRFPKEFCDRGVDISQRYFLDKHTATVHFVALTTGA